MYPNELSNKLHTRNQSDNKLLRRKVDLTFKNTKRLQGRSLFVSQSGLTMMCPLYLLRGIVCMIEFDMLLDGKLRKVAAISKTQESVCVGTEGFRTDLRFIEIDSESQKVLQDLMSQRI